MKIYLEGIQKKKQEGSMVDVPLKSSNLQIIELNTDDKRRFKKLKEISGKTETHKKERKPEIKQDKNNEEKK